MWTLCFPWNQRPATRLRRNKSKHPSMPYAIPKRDNLRRIDRQTARLGAESQPVIRPRCHAAIGFISGCPRVLRAIGSGEKNDPADSLSELWLPPEITAPWLLRTVCFNIGGRPCPDEGAAFSLPRLPVDRQPAPGLLHFLPPGPRRIRSSVSPGRRDRGPGSSVAGFVIQLSEKILGLDSGTRGTAPCRVWRSMSGFVSETNLGRHGNSFRRLDESPVPNPGKMRCHHARAILLPCIPPSLPAG